LTREWTVNAAYHWCASRAQTKFGGRMALNLNGLVPATVLPMHADGSIDEAGLRSYIAWIARQGPVALAINVDTGEGPHLTHDEKIRVLRVVREVTELPIVAGIAGPSTDAAVRQARDFKAAGADALLVFPIPAYLSEPLDVRIPVQYHEAIADVCFTRTVGDYRVRLKECLCILGVLEAAHVRKPLLAISDAERAHLAGVLTEVGLLRDTAPTLA